jgi:putative hydrolase of the HAD superfamily
MGEIASGGSAAAVDAVLFDLGNTLAQYYQRDEFPGILREAIGSVQDELAQQKLLRVAPQEVWERAQAEDHEAEDHQVRPLEGRLARIFGLEGASEEVMEALCRRFLAPILARGRCYPEAMPVLRCLRARGIRTALVSNTPWGSPAGLWREEIERLGLGDWLDASVFCRDAGWRKPATPIFVLALKRVGADASRCLFVGDDPRWDLAGAQAVGIEAILVQRAGGAPYRQVASITELYGVLSRLGLEAREGKI